MSFQVSNFILIKYFVIGICFGSFFNVVVYRLPQGLSIVKPRSFCPNCKKTISWKENIPLLSWSLQKGRCLNCRKNISLTYPLIEILAGLSFVIFSFSSPEIHESIDNKYLLNISSWTFFSIIFLISLIDIKKFWVPQILINFGFLFGTFNFLLVKYISRENVVSDFIYYFLTVVFSYSIFELIRKLAKFYFKKEALGQGDSKLVAMTSLWLGPIGTLLSVGISYIFAAIFLLVGLGMKITKKGDLIPFAPFLSFGALVVWYFGNYQIIKIIFGY